MVILCTINESMPGAELPKWLSSSSELSLLVPEWLPNLIFKSFRNMISAEFCSSTQMTSIVNCMCSICIIKMALGIPNVNNSKHRLGLNHFHGGLILVCSSDNSALLAKSELYLNNNCRQMTCKSIYKKASSCIHYWFSAMFPSRLMLWKCDLQCGLNESLPCSFPSPIPRYNKVL